MISVCIIPFRADNEHVKVFFIKLRTAIFKPFIIHHPSFDGEIFDDGVCPLSELHSTLIVDLEANSNNNLEIVVNNISGYLTII